MITIGITNFDVKRILIDDGSVVKVLFLDVFKAIGLKEDDLKPATPYMAFPTNP